DANQGYTRKQAIWTIQRMAELGVSLAEQPVAARDLEGLALVTRSVDVIVEADESVQSFPQAAQAIQARAVDAISVKLIKMGGLQQARRVAALCAEAGILC